MPKGKAANPAFPDYKSNLRTRRKGLLILESGPGGKDAIGFAGQSIGIRIVIMLLIANEETIDRLVKQGSLLLSDFHAEHKNDSNGNRAEFLRGEFTGWHSTPHAE